MKTDIEKAIKVVRTKLRVTTDESQKILLREELAKLKKINKSNNMTEKN